MMADKPEVYFDQIPPVAHNVCVDFGRQEGHDIDADKPSGSLVVDLLARFDARGRQHAKHFRFDMTRIRIVRTWISRYPEPRT